MYQIIFTFLLKNKQSKVSYYCVSDGGKELLFNAQNNFIVDFWQPLNILCFLYQLMFLLLIKNASKKVLNC